jgi:addiction module HigA family antidote
MTERDWHAPVHPGEVLAEELDFIGMTASALAEKIGVPKNRLYQIIRGERNVTADTALRLGVFFGTGPRLWLNLQKTYELDMAGKEIKASLKKIVPYAAQDSRSSSGHFA